MRWKMWLSQTSRLNLKTLLLSQNIPPHSSSPHLLTSTALSMNTQALIKKENHQNRRDDNYIKEKLINQNQQSQQIERQAINRSRRIKIPSYKARQNIIPINEVSEPSCGIRH